MKHLLQGRYLAVAVVSAVAATLAAGAFGLPAATADDPAPIELRSEALDQQLAPVPLGDADGASDAPAEPTPVTSPTPVTPPSAPTAPSLVTPDPAPAPVVESQPATTQDVSYDSPDSPDSPASADSIDS